MSTMTALLVIDVQNHLIANPENPAYNAESVLANIADLQQRAHAAHVPVIFMQHESDAGGAMALGSFGWQIHPQVAPVVGDIVLAKNASDSFYHTDLADALNALGITHLVITGLRSEMCVDTTCRAAISCDYDVTLVSDAHSTRDDDGGLSAGQIVEHHNRNLDDFGTDEHAIVLSRASDIAFV
ncbi:isochorismatase [Ktedonobacteria bacterium brp13]|nr:isochorismatase [Ktedonobacteria bacterium brp13]